MLGFSKVALVAGAIAFFSIGAAQAVPSFTNPNFTSGSALSAPYADGVGSTVTGWTSAGFAGTAPQDNGYWYNNGAGGATVGFLEGGGANFQQTVSGFTIGNIYTVTTLANARAGNPMSGLYVFQNGTPIFAGAVASVDLLGTYATPFGSYLSSTFIASSASLLFEFSNAVPGDNALLLSSVSLQDLGPSVPAVPEPISAALLGAGLAFTFWTRRRNAAI